MGFVVPRRVRSPVTRAVVGPVGSTARLSKVAVGNRSASKKSGPRRWAFSAS